LANEIVACYSINWQHIQNYKLNTMNCIYTSDFPIIQSTVYYQLVYHTIYQQKSWHSMLMKWRYLDYWWFNLIISELVILWLLHHLDSPFILAGVPLKPLSNFTLLRQFFRQFTHLDSFYKTPPYFYQESSGQKLAFLPPKKHDFSYTLGQNEKKSSSPL